VIVLQGQLVKLISSEATRRSCCRSTPSSVGGSADSTPWNPLWSQLSHRVPRLNEVFHLQAPATLVGRLPVVGGDGSGPGATLRPAWFVEQRLPDGLRGASCVFSPRASREAALYVRCSSNNGIELTADISASSAVFPGTVLLDCPSRRAGPQLIPGVRCSPPGSVEHGHGPVESFWVLPLLFHGQGGWARASPPRPGHWRSPAAEATSDGASSVVSQRRSSFRASL
jgi:hypothetical protein